MRFLKYMFLVTTALVIGQSYNFAQLSTIDSTSPSITQDINSAIDINAISDPLRDGAQFIAQSPDENNHLNILKFGDYLAFGDAQDATLTIVRNIINVILGFVALIVLILLIFEGYKLVVAGDNSTHYQQTLGKLKNYAIAIAGIALSRFLINFILYVLGQIIIF